MIRAATILFSVIALLSAGGCGAWRGSKDINTEPPSEGIGSGPGILSGRNGGMVIYQK
jgi:hypothetical protein